MGGGEGGVGTALGRSSSHRPGGTRPRASQSPRLTGPPCNADPSLRPRFLNQKIKGLKEPVFPLLRTLWSRFPGPTLGDSDSWVLGGAQESMFLMRLKRSPFWLSCRDPTSGGLASLAG